MNNLKRRGREFKPREPYTHRLRRILEEYPDGSQVLREILQNSDDAKSTEQVFILDHNTYPSDKLLEPDSNNYERANLTLNRYQGPALLAKNNTIFEERDFASLLKLADSEKQDQFDKIGVMGVGFNSIYHITDSPSFITGNKYVILDPHERYFNGGVQYDFDEELIKGYPDHFAPFKIPCNEPSDDPFNHSFKGTIFRYPLRNSTESKISEISKKDYKLEEILDMFHRFYENESINCLLFLKYIECISFYELKKGATELELLYKIQLKNADEVRQQRRLIVEAIVPMMNLLIKKELNNSSQLEATYVASFSRQEGEKSPEETSSWLILNYLDDLLETEEYFQKKFRKSIGDYKFIPNVGLAFPLNDLNATGKLFCFLPLPISMPFLVSVHGYFAVSTNRRSLWSSSDGEDLAADGLANLKIEWNKYLFEKVLPKAWAIFLRGLPEVSDIQSNDIDIYKFWPIGSALGIINTFCKDLLKNVIENLNIEDCVFKGPSSSNAIGTVPNISADSYNAFSSKEFEFHWLSLSSGYLGDIFRDEDLIKIIGNIGFPVISVSSEAIRVFKSSRHKDSLKYLSPAIIRTYLNSNRTRWEGNALSRKEVLQLFQYILTDRNFDELEGFKMIPLADNTLGTLTRPSNSCDSYVYIEEITEHRNDDCNIFKNQLNTNKLIDKSIDSKLYKCLYDNARAKWKLNIKILDEIRISDLILIIRNMVNKDEDKELSTDEIKNVIEILKRIAKMQNYARIDENDLESLYGLLIPSTENKLVGLDTIHFDDMGDNEDEEMHTYIIAHPLVTRDIVEGLGIQNLKGTIFGNNNTGDIDWEVYEQDESLITRIRNIIKDYSMKSLFKEFLQNADDAGATKFSVYVDERENNSTSKTFLSEEMEGPAIWIYNDAEFTDNDFQSLLKLGIGGKNRDDKKIGRFGIGFNCAFHVTDLPSFVSGKYIAYLDPQQKFLPAQGFPSKKPRGTRINFIDKMFKRRFPEQCYPYEALGCDLSKEFKGTLFKLPLRTETSKISDKVFETGEILELFSDIQDNNEMLFLRNVESCSLYRIIDSDPPKLIWQAKINNIDSCRDSRREVIDGIDEAQIYQLDIERINNMDEKVSEIWLLCTGGHDDVIDQNLREFSEDRRLKPRGGVASLLARSDNTISGDNKSLDESLPGLPKIKGEIYSYLSLSMNTNLGVHLNGNFSLSSARSGVLQSGNSVLQANGDDAKKWNDYILYDLLPDLQIKLIDHVVNKHENGEANFIQYITNNLWPNSGLYKDYGLSVIRKLDGCHRIFWTEAGGGKFISLEDAKIFGTEEEIIADILVSSGVQAVKLDRDKIEQLNEIAKSGDPPDFSYKPVSGESVCEDLRMVKSSIPSFEGTHNSLFKLLNFILRDEKSFKILEGLPLVPLNNGSVGKFGEVYYVGGQIHLNLFPKNGPSRFVSVNLPGDLSKIFNDDNFSAKTKIKKFGPSAILDLLSDELEPVRELKWNPYEGSLPNRSWLDKIWSILVNDTTDFGRLSTFPLLPVVKPSDMLVRPNVADPLLYVPYTPGNEHALFPLFPVLAKLKVRITNMKFPGNVNEELQKCVIECNPVNVINSLERTRARSTMVRLFEISKLIPQEYGKFRTYIKDELKTLVENGKKQGNFMNILKSIPIWPLHSSDVKFVDATSGKLYPSKLTFFSFNKKTDFYNHDDHKALIELGVIPMSELKYLEVIVQQITKKFPKPSEEYVTFLKKVLSLGNEEIEQYLKRYEVIPNRSLKKFVKVDTLYDDVHIFRNLFVNSTDKFLPLELQNNSVCLEALKRMGLNQKIPPPLPSDSDKMLQKDVLISSLLEKLETENKYHDAIFTFEGEEPILANRYLLSATSKKFEEMFDNSSESIPIESKRDIFWVFLQLLYGMSIEAVTKRLAGNFETEQGFEIYYLTFLVDLLKLSVAYEVKSLTNMIEDTIISGQHISIRNLCIIIKCLEECNRNVQRLRDHYKTYINSIKKLVDDQLSELKKNGTNEEVSQISEMIDLFLR